MTLNSEHKREELPGSPQNHRDCHVLECARICRICCGLGGWRGGYWHAEVQRKRERPGDRVDPGTGACGALTLPLRPLYVRLAPDARRARARCADGLLADTGSCILPVRTHHV